MSKLFPFWKLKPPLPPTERITNGGFEEPGYYVTPPLGWENDGTSGNVEQFLVHSGLWACEITCYTEFESWIRQTFSGVLQSKIASFGLWQRGVSSGQLGQVTISYSDGTSTVVNPDAAPGYVWVYVDLLPNVEVGKTVIGIKISHNAYMSPYFNVDDVSLIAYD